MFRNACCLDAKCEWALRHLDFFPVEVNRDDYMRLLRVPGIDVRSARKILEKRAYAKLSFSDLKKLGVVLEQAGWFLTCQGKRLREPMRFADVEMAKEMEFRQLSFFDLEHKG